MPKMKMHIKKDDKVKVIAGKDRGKIGKVLKVIAKDDRVLVEKVNIVKRHMRPNAQMKQGGIVENEAPIHVSNVQVMCDKCVKPVRIKMQHLEDGTKVRACRNCNEIIGG